MNAVQNITMIQASSNDLEDEQFQTNPTKAAEAFRDIREAYEELTEQYKDAKALYDQARHITIPQIFEAAGVSSLTVGGRRFTVSTNVRCSMVGGAKEDCLDWLRANDLGDIISETVHAGTLAGTAKAEIEKGFQLPEELFNTHYVENTSMTKVVAKKG